MDNDYGRCPRFRPYGPRQLRVVALCASIAIAGCQQKPEEVPLPTQSAFQERGFSDGLILRYTDAQTGCTYLIFAGYRKGGITPRLRSDGTPDCGTTRKDAP